MYLTSRIFSQIYHIIHDAEHLVVYSYARVRTFDYKIIWSILSSCIRTRKHIIWTNSKRTNLLTIYKWKLKTFKILVQWTTQVNVIEPYEDKPN